jgi:hypothetical protein
MADENGRMPGVRFCVFASHSKLCAPQLQQGKIITKMCVFIMSSIWERRKILSWKNCVSEDNRP